MVNNGPRGLSEKDIVRANSLLLAKDIAAVDAAAIKIYGLSPVDIPYLQLASEQNMGTIDLNNLSIKKINLS